MAARIYESKGVRYNITLKGTPSMTNDDVAWEFVAVTKQTDNGTETVALPAAETIISGSEDVAFQRVFNLIDKL